MDVGNGQEFKGGFVNEIINWSGFVDIDFNPHDFIETEIPELHPLSSDYLIY